VKRHLPPKETYDPGSKQRDDQTLDREIAEHAGRVLNPQFNGAYRAVEGRMEAVYADYEALRELAQAYDPEIQMLFRVEEGPNEPIVSIILVGYDLHAHLEVLRTATQHASAVCISPACDPHMISISYDYRGVYLPISEPVAP
jgi:hypothetical protein